MKAISKSVLMSALGLMLISSVTFAQQNGGWRAVGEGQPAMAPNSEAAPYPSDQMPAPQAPVYQAPGYPNAPMNQAGPAPSAVPPQLTLKAGTWITVRTSDWLSSDHNHTGDAFFATLAEPVVVDGLVIAHRGQTISGRVTDAKKAGMVSGTSSLGLELTNLTLVDGQQISLHSVVVNRNGPTSVGRDVAGVATTTGLGAAVGAGIGAGGGAAVGAGAGMLVGLAGVLLTRGRPTIIYPETVLTFEVQQPVTISTEHTPYAFRPVEGQDYPQNGTPQPRLMTRPGYPGGGYPPYGPAYPYPPTYSPYPYYYGPSVGVVIGRGWYGPRYWRH